MNNMMKEILEGMKMAEIANVDDAMNYLEVYFSMMCWSLEQEEWKKMNKNERTELCEKLLSHM